MNKFLALHKACRECVWLRSIIQHTQKACGLAYGKINATTTYKDNTACMTQLKDDYIKRDRTKHISPKFLFTHDLPKPISSSYNLLDFFSNSLPNRTFNQLVQKIDIEEMIVQLRYRRLFLSSLSSIFIIFIFFLLSININ